MIRADLKRIRFGCMLWNLEYFLCNGGIDRRGNLSKGGLTFTLRQSDTLTSLGSPRRSPEFHATRNARQSLVTDKLLIASAGSMIDPGAGKSSSEQAFG
jgi:hypothetical protein